MERSVAELERLVRAHAWSLTENPRPPCVEHSKTGDTGRNPVGEESPKYCPQERAPAETSLAELEKILRARICRVCSDRREDGSCGLEKPAECPLFRYLPQVVRAIQTTESTDVTDYIRAIRSEVCSICPQQAADGSCALRDQVRCALDAYLLLIVDAIEEAMGKQLSRRAAWYSR